MCWIGRGAHGSIKYGDLDKMYNEHAEGLCHFLGRRNVTGLEKLGDDFGEAYCAGFADKNSTKGVFLSISEGTLLLDKYIVNFVLLPIPQRMQTLHVECA